MDNQDLPRFNSLQSDKTIVYNAIVGTFLRAGIPAIYYGLEQDLKDGTEDPKNREPLWQYGNYATDGPTYQRIKTLNGIRKALGGDAEWLKASGRTVAVQQNDIALKRKDTLIVLTNVSCYVLHDFKLTYSEVKALPEAGKWTRPDLKPTPRS